LSQDKSQPTLQRILVPLDASEHSMAALSAAAELASALGAELEGLFVEDIHLLQLCEFPFVREISLLGPSFRRIDRTETERHLKIRAEHLKRVLADVAKKFNVPWKFRVTRGGVSKEVLAASEEADLTILGRAGWSMARSPRVGSTVRTVVSQGRGLTLIMQHGGRIQPSVQVLFTGSQLSEKALGVALDLGGQKDLFLVVLMVTHSQENLEPMQNRVKNIIAGRKVQASLHVLQDLDYGLISRLVRVHGPGPLFIPCEEPHLHGEALQTLIGSLENPVFLVRQARKEK